MPGKTAQYMNDLIRRKRGQPIGHLMSLPEPPVATPPEMATARQYAETLGLTLLEALAKMRGGAVPAPRPSAAAGAGTKNPPTGKPTMNEIIRRKAGR